MPVCLIFMQKNLPESFGAYLKFLRRRARLTQDELARAVGYSREQVVRLERNQRLPDRTVTAALFLPALGLRADSSEAAHLLELAARARAGNDVPQNQLPVELTSFVGRQREIAELSAILKADISNRAASPLPRLVTLTGVGGTGKTRLALRTAHALEGVFRDGVWFVELSHLTEPVSVPESVAAALGFLLPKGRDSVQALQDFLQRQESLIVLDNCEHLLDACAYLADRLLRAAPRVKILATSREALGIAGECVYPVRSLALPDAREMLLELVKQSDAVHLFCDRATAVQPDFRVTFENVSAVVQICARLDGIPLALELAAARVSSMSVEQIAARLDDRFRLLTGGSRTALPRQRTLQAAIDWSYKLLSNAERILFQRLAVFAGSWTLEAAESVCADDADVCASAVAEILGSLVNKSLVVTKLETRAPRYAMLETIRQYAQEKFDASEETESIRARHLQYFVAFAAQAEPHLRGAGQAQWMAQLDLEYDNLIAALTWAVDGDTASGLRLVSDLRRYWIYRAHLHEPRVLAERLLEADRAADALTRAEAYHLAGMLEFFIGNLERAKAFGHKSKALCLQVGRPALAMLGYAENVIVYSELHTAPEEQKLLEKNLPLFREAGDRWGEAHTMFNIAQAMHADGNYAGAEKLYRQSMLIFRECGDEFRTLQQTAALAFLAYEQGKLARARKQLEQIYTLYRQRRLNIEIDAVLATLGAIAIREHDMDAARMWYRECLLFEQQIGMLTQLPECCIGFAHIAFAENQLERAAKLLGAAESEIQARQLGLGKFERAESERIVSALVSALGADEFETAFAYGNALTREQVLALALQNA